MLDHVELNLLPRLPDTALYGPSFGEAKEKAIGCAAVVHREEVKYFNLGACFGSLQAFN